MKVRIIIPVHLDSKRLPRKALLTKKDIPMFQYVYEACQRSNADSIAIACNLNTINVIQDLNTRDEFRFNITEEKHINGTSRVAEAARQYPIDDLIINVQCDYPEISEKAINKLIDKVIAYHKCNFGCDIITLYYRLLDNINLIQLNTNNVKIAISGNDKCRSIIPYKAHWFSRSLPYPYIHVGIYAYYNKILQDLIIHKQTKESIKENLEQLTWIQNNHLLHLVETDLIHSINCQEDYEEWLAR